MKKKSKKLKKKKKIQISVAKIVCQYLAKGSLSAYRRFQSWLQFSENDKWRMSLKKFCVCFSFVTNKVNCWLYVATKTHSLLPSPGFYSILFPIPLSECWSQPRFSSFLTFSIFSHALIFDCHLQHCFSWQIKLLAISLHRKCPYSELFWSVFSRMRTEYGEIWSISPEFV